MNISLRSHLTMGTAALFSVAAIAMNPVTESNMTTVATRAATPVSQTLEVVLAASIFDLLPGVEVIGPTPEGCGKGCGPLVSYSGGTAFACGPSPTCYVAQIYIRPAVQKFNDTVVNPFLEWLLPGATTNIGGAIAIPIALLLSPVLVPIRIVQSLIKPAPVKPAAATRGVKAAAAIAALPAPSAPKAAAIQAPGASKSGKAAAAVRAARKAAPRAAAAAHAAPRAAAIQAPAKAAAQSKGTLRAARR